MAKGMEFGQAEGMAKGMELGKVEKAKSIARKMLDEGMSIAMVCKVTGLTETETEIEKV